MDRYDDYRQPNRPERRPGSRPPQRYGRPDPRERRGREDDGHDMYQAQRPRQKRAPRQQRYPEQESAAYGSQDSYAYQDPYASQDPYAAQDPYGYQDAYDYGDASPQPKKAKFNVKQFFKKFGLYILVFFFGVLIGSIGGGGDEKTKEKEPPQQQEQQVKVPEAKPEEQREAPEEETEKETERSTVKKTTRATEKKTEKTDKDELSPEDIAAIKAEALDVTYNEVMRNPDAYIGKYVLVGGKISQVLGGNQYYLYDDFNWGGESYMDHRWGVLYEVQDGDRILEGDIVNFYGIFTGTQKLTTVLGAEMEVPVVMGITHDFISQAQ